MCSCLVCLGPVLVGSLLAPELLSAMAAAIACTAVFSASNAACEVACVIASYSAAIHFSIAYFADTALLESAFFCAAYLCLIEIFTSDTT